MTEANKDKIIETYVDAYLDNLPSYISRSEQSVHLAVAKANAQAVAAVLASLNLPQPSMLGSRLRLMSERGKGS